MEQSRKRSASERSDASTATSEPATKRVGTVRDMRLFQQPRAGQSSARLPGELLLKIASESSLKSQAVWMRVAQTYFYECKSNVWRRRSFAAGAYLFNTVAASGPGANALVRKEHDSLTAIADVTFDPASQPDWRLAWTLLGYRLARLPNLRTITVVHSFRSPAVDVTLACCTISDDHPVKLIMYDVESAVPGSPMMLNYREPYRPVVEPRWLPPCVTEVDLYFLGAELDCLRGPTFRDHLFGDPTSSTLSSLTLVYNPLCRNMTASERSSEFGQVWEMREPFVRELAVDSPRPEDTVHGYVRYSGLRLRIGAKVLQGHACQSGAGLRGIKRLAAIYHAIQDRETDRVPSVAPTK